MPFHKGLTALVGPALAVLVLAAAALRPAPGAAAQTGSEPLPKDYPVRPVPFTDVRLTDAFWAPRLETNRTVSVPYALRMNEETGRVDNFRKAARLMPGAYKGKRYNDSDIYKAMEGAAYTLRLHPDPALERTLDDLVALIGKAQEPDGYLYTARTVDPSEPRARRRARALVEPARQPRALQRRAHVRGGRRPLSGDRPSGPSSTSP